MANQLTDSRPGAAQIAESDIGVRVAGLTRARELAAGFGHCLERVVEHQAEIGRDPILRQRVGNALARARDDFLDADLSAVNLDGVWLDGVQWSESTTRWPDAWVEEIRSDSVEIFDGVFEVRKGNLRPKAPVPA